MGNSIGRMVKTYAYSLRLLLLSAVCYRFLFFPVLVFVAVSCCLVLSDGPLASSTPPGASIDIAPLGLGCESEACRRTAATEGKAEGVLRSILARPNVVRPERYVMR